MDKLKTLKDITEKLFIEKAIKEEDIYIIDELRQVAIERYKYWKKVTTAPPDMSTFINYMQIWGRMAELKDMFNLREDEIK